eukprot:1156565-Pelagomonas_calceolata.AAC.2
MHLQAPAGTCMYVCQSKLALMCSKTERPRLGPLSTSAHDPQGGTTSVCANRTQPGSYASAASLRARPKILTNIMQQRLQKEAIASWRRAAKCVEPLCRET